MIEIKKRDVKLYSLMCNYAEAYMDLHNIRRPGVSRVIRAVKDEVKTVLLQHSHL